MKTINTYFTGFLEITNTHAKHIDNFIIIDSAQISGLHLYHPSPRGVIDDLIDFLSVYDFAPVYGNAKLSLGNVIRHKIRHILLNEAIIRVYH